MLKPVFNCCLLNCNKHIYILYAYILDFKAQVVLSSLCHTRFKRFDQKGKFSSVCLNCYYIAKSLNKYFIILLDSLIQLLRRPVNQRLGSGPEDAEAIKYHPFFRHINWDDVYHRRLEPPFKPPLVRFQDFMLSVKDIIFFYDC